MNERNASRMRGVVLRSVATISIGLLAACASASTRPAYAPEPQPCADTVYVQLKAQHPDSLSERAWQRLQSLDRDCTAARADSRGVEQGGTVAHHRTWWMASGLIMAAMMIGMWSR